MQPKGFWSYARDDDGHLAGVVSSLRKRIEGEVSMLLGEYVTIFQDIHDLRTGDRWAEKLRDGITATTFLIPVLSPRFFKRPWCKEEVLTYLRLSKEKGVEPRIFPILFVDFDDDENCEVRTALRPFQYKSFTQWRFESDPTVKAKLEYEFAKDVKDRLKSSLPAPTIPSKSSKSMIESAAVVTSERAGDNSAPSVLYKTHVVDPMPRRGDFQCIKDAIDAAEPGDRIVIREGTYRESLRLSKPLELLGEGDPDGIVIVAVGNFTLRCDAPMARIRGVRFRQEAGRKGCSLLIVGGSVEIEDCNIESLSLACVEIKGVGTRPTLRRCTMRRGASYGIFIWGGAEPSIEDCTMVENQHSGVRIHGEDTRPVLRRCIVRDGMQSGIYFSAGAAGVMEACEVTGNMRAGVEIIEAANPMLRNCMLRGNKGTGLSVYSSGKGEVVGCEITKNGNAGIYVDEAGSPIVANCFVSSNAYEAVWIKDAQSGGLFRDNDLTGNSRGPWDIAEGATVTRERNKE